MMCLVLKRGGMSELTNNNEKLWWAAAKGSEPLAKAALEQGASWLAVPRLDCNDLWNALLPKHWANRSALAVALSSGACSLGEHELFKQGPDALAGSLIGETLLMVACQAANADWVERWAPQSKSLESRNSEGMTALAMSAVSASGRREKSFRCASALIAAGADLEARDKNGVTPIMWAINSSDAQMVKLLACAGADLQAGYMGWSVMDTAFAIGGEGVFDWLKGYEQSSNEKKELMLFESGQTQRVSAQRRTRI